MRVPLKRICSAALLLTLLAAAFLAAPSSRRAPPCGPSDRGTREVLYWVDPMHPTYKSDQPGIAPDCGMALEPVYRTDGTLANESSLPPAALRVSAEKQQTIGVRIAQVETSPVRHTIRTVGRVTVDENRSYRLVAAVDGIVRELGPSATGSFVRRDQVLLTYYSSEFLGAQQAYFYALKTLDLIEGDSSEPTEQAILTNAQLRSAVDTMRNLGMSDVQIRDLGKVRRLVRDIELRSPVSGYVLSRSVFPRERLERGAELYRIADLSRLWVFAHVFESEARYVRPGTAALLSLPSRQGEPLRARISDVLPQLDPTTRTLKFRLDIDNRDLALQPDMFVDVEFAAHPPRRPDGAAGRGRRLGAAPPVFVDRGAGYFEPRRVETGWRFGDRVEIVKGLCRGAHRRLRQLPPRLGEPDEGRGRGDRHGGSGPGLRHGGRRDEGAGETAGRVSMRTSYSFCSESCQKQFDANPERFVHGRSAPSPPRPGQGKGRRGRHERVSATLPRRARTAQRRTSARQNVA